jgi:hypothetical protein
MDIFYFYLIRCLKRKEKNREEERESLYIEPVAFSILEYHLENAAGAYKERNLLYI